MNKKLVLKIILIIILLCRIGVPFLIFSYPLQTFLLTIILDYFDGLLFNLLGFRWYQYNTIDKILDYWWYLFILLFLRGQTVFTIGLILFIYRGIGQFIGIVMRNEKVYLYFPNILEWFFLTNLLFPNSQTNILLLVSISWSLIIEWLIHKSHLHLISKYIFHQEMKWK
ncbi:hypothetical protein MUP32_01940 [Candidatus Microgenomates bacterium]|nr:hypothetical protein [Candidatus Microgenomates bacterium]